VSEAKPVSNKPVSFGIEDLLRYKANIEAGRPSLSHALERSKSHYRKAPEKEESFHPQAINKLKNDVKPFRKKLHIALLLKK
jgi:hypothetical protein